MRLASFIQDGTERLGFVTGADLVDPFACELPAAAKPWFRNAVAFIAAGEPALDLARRLVATAPPAARRPLADLQLAPPIRPSTILCAGSNYREHNEEKANTPLSGREPEFFVKTSDCVIGPAEPIVFDGRLTQKLDCETELAVVIGRPGRHIPVERALEHVFGYTIVNDVTARGRQVRTSPSGTTWYELGRGKVFDTSAPLGPVIVTADEIPDPQRLAIRTRINGELRQSSSTAQMIWSCAELIHFFSVNVTLRPGMVIITGTPAGTAWSTDASLGGRWQPQPGLIAATRYCLPDDVVACEIETIGVLSNPIVGAASAA
jgi:2-keto-4-pentenoate hydratase/2-oxohepta-3-ene-1,7-dioic acid hydratase in catechol pathway